MAEQQTEPCKCIVAVRVRGTVSAQREARETLELLQLVHTNHAVILDSRPSFWGMLQRAQSYVTWGEATPETINLMLKQRGRLSGNKKMTDEYAQEKLQCRRRSRLPRRSHKPTRQTHGLNNQRLFIFPFVCFKI
jgi:ribosomal protein L30/L7E